MSNGYRKVSSALISVHNKQGLSDFASNLSKLGVELIATGGTRSVLEVAGVSAKKIEDFARFPELLDGRVKTLQPEILAGILSRRTNAHLEQLKRFNIEPIDMVVCNFYPFEQVVSKLNVSFEEVVENIDIGGPTMVRAAAKNHESTAVVTSPKLYDKIILELQSNNCCLSQETRLALAEMTFGMVAAYDIAIYNGIAKFGKRFIFPDRFFISGTKFEDAKYGENPDQKAAVYKLDGYKGMLSWSQLHGDSRSFNNHFDIGHAYEILDGFNNVIAAATIKHGNISGFAFSPTIEESYKLAHECDPEADYGCTTVLNRRVDAGAARLIGKNSDSSDKSVYTEIVVAPGYNNDALEILKAKQTKKIRIIEVTEYADYPFDLRLIQGSLLVQTPPDYNNKLNLGSLSFPTKIKPDDATLNKLRAAWELVRKVESNGVVICEGIFDGSSLTHFWTLGVGSFRKRNGAVKIALDNAGKRATGSIVASDGFFPFPDSIELLANAGVKAVISPSGSIRDKAIIESADRCGISLVLTNTRAFKH